eukprot:jgi/Chlat1/2005/Chrsp158S02298
MRRRPGVAGLQHANAAKEQYRTLGENVARVRLAELAEQLATFKTSLENFAHKYKAEIRRQPAFRAQFHEMCARVGVDPLASNKGVWAQLLSIGDFYYELGVQILEACLASRSINGGLMDLRDLHTAVVTKRGARGGEVSEDDVVRAIGKLKALGGGFELLTVGQRKLVRSVPTELNKDHNTVIERAQGVGYVTEAELQQALGWSSGRIKDALSYLMKVSYYLLRFGIV